MSHLDKRKSLFLNPEGPILEKEPTSVISETVLLLMRHCCLRLAISAQRLFFLTLRQSSEMIK